MNICVSLYVCMYVCMYMYMYIPLMPLRFKPQRVLRRYLLPDPGRADRQRPAQQNQPQGNPSPTPNPNPHNKT